MNHSPVEKYFLDKSKRRESYGGEKIPVVEVLNIFELGKLVALTFLEWINDNPNGIIALPTGKSPEYFIKTLERYKKGWNTPEIANEIKGYGCQLSKFPETSNLKFVMLDEFFPMLPTHRNSFCRYVRSYYLPSMDIKPENVLDFDLIQRGIVTEEEMKVFDRITVDLTLLERAAVNPQEVVQQTILKKVANYCQFYEDKVREWGGIGFFLGGIGPDGHIAFNQEGCAHDSLTRLVSFNYPSAAAAAGDLGGIEIARQKAAMTIGLKTITANKDAKIVIMAAGEGKAQVVRAAIEDSADPDRPASVLHNLPNARFYITHGAASKLTARREDIIENVCEDCFSWVVNHLSGSSNFSKPYLALPSYEYGLIESVIYEASLKTGIPVHKLQVEDVSKEKGSLDLPIWLKTNPLKFQMFAACAARRLKEKIEGGMIEATPTSHRILHTAPHHDDIMLSYHAAMHDMLGRLPATQNVGIRQLNSNDKLFMSPNKTVAKPFRARSRSGSFTSYVDNVLGEKCNGNLNHFAYLTSGFHSVNDDFLTKKAQSVLALSPKSTNGTVLEEIVFSGDLTCEYDDLMSRFREAFFHCQNDRQEDIENIIFLRKIAEVWQISFTQSYNILINELKSKANWILNDYLAKHQAGDSVPKEMQLLKGCMRESEVDRVWALSSMPMNRVHHLRSKFYTDDFFTPMPSLEDDALPMANLIKARQPDVLTVAFDPEGTGPDTHYKVLQVVAAGIRVCMTRSDLENEDMLIWGYRNVWFVFPPSDATLFIPCSEDDLNLMHDTFMACFTTQKAASFPSPYYDGPFSAWARQIQKDQRKMLSTLLGEEYFQTHSNPRIRDCTGFIFIHAMHVREFLKQVEELKSKFENIS